MSKLYRITPLEKKSVEYFVDVFERMPNGRMRGFDVTETWRWGQAFRELGDEVWQHEIDRVHCRPETGWGCELDDLCAVHINFGCWDHDGNFYDDGFTEEEKAQIESLLRWESEDEDGRCGTAWLYDGDHNWEIEDDHVAVLGPFKIELVDDDHYNEPICEVQPYQPEQSKSNTDWPFPTTDKEEND